MAAGSRSPMSASMRVRHICKCPPRQNAMVHLEPTCPKATLCVRNDTFLPRRTVSAPEPLHTRHTHGGACIVVAPSTYHPSAMTETETVHLRALVSGCRLPYCGFAVSILSQTTMERMAKALEAQRQMDTGRMAGKDTLAPLDRAKVVTFTTTPRVGGRSERSVVPPGILPGSALHIH